jgi:hypothetical protein
MNTKALLVGINKYPDPRNSLRGCINDILDMEYLILDKNKVYAKEHIKKITDQEATKKGILQQIEWLIKDPAPGDQLLFHYSGHGAQAPTLHPAIEKDGLDEIICPYDYDGTNETMLRDKEFSCLFAGIPKGVHFVWISDSCHAEDLSRDPIYSNQISYRNFIADSFISNNKYLAAATSKTLQLPSNVNSQPLNGALLSACASDELSTDAIINKRYNGAFTHYLIENIITHGANKPMELIIQLVNVDLKHNGYDQIAQSEGTLTHKTFFNTQL